LKGEQNADVKYLQQVVYPHIGNRKMAEKANMPKDISCCFPGCCLWQPHNTMLLAISAGPISPIRPIAGSVVRLL